MTANKGSTREQYKAEHHDRDGNILHMVDKVRILTKGGGVKKSNTDMVQKLSKVVSGYMC
eukprot:13409343-Ditylum_brightwellii.AAC.1